MKKEQKKNSRDSQSNLLEQESTLQKLSQTKLNILEDESIGRSQTNSKPLSYELYDVLEIDELKGCLWLLDIEAKCGRGYLVLRPLDRKRELVRVSMRTLRDKGARVVDHYNEKKVLLLFSKDK